MINPKELRIGNLVYREGIIRMIKSIRDDYFDLCFEYSHGVHYGTSEDLDPIPLTHEILEKAGGKFCNALGYEWYFFKNDQYNVIIDHRGQRFFIKDSHSELQSVHQLQNLFHALTGEELEIKL